MRPKTPCSGPSVRLNYRTLADVKVIDSRWTVLNRTVGTAKPHARAGDAAVDWLRLHEFDAPEKWMYVEAR